MLRDLRYLLEQRRGLLALGRLLVAPDAVRGEIPGPVLAYTADAPSPTLVAEFVRFVGGDPSSYRETLPPHLFPQWCLPAMLDVTRSLPYPKTGVINAGCELRVLSPIPVGQPLKVTAQVLSVDETVKRALIHLRLTTGAVSEPAALQAELRLYVRLKREKRRDSIAPPKPRVPASALELRTQRFTAGAGGRFACLTGDVNPIHWLPPYARAAGFRGCILHGFGSFAATFEGLVRARFSGDPSRVKSLNANFARPLPLPASVGLYELGGREVYLGDAPGGAAYLTGEFEHR